MIHPSTELKFINDTVGYGVIAKTFIPKGTITWVKDDLDREFTIEEVEKMNPKYRDVLDMYCYRNRKGNYVFCWDYTKYMNHSFFPNCLPTAYGFEIAIKDIQPGEQLTNDYGCLNIIESFEPLDEGAQRKVIHPDDLLHYHKEWDTKIMESIFFAKDIEQPLKKYLEEETWQTIEDIIDKKCDVKSILECYCDDTKS